MPDQADGTAAHRCWDERAADEKKRRKLKERARALSIKPVMEGDGVEYMEIIKFRLASEEFAFDIAHVREVYLLREITPLPCTPAFVRGIANVRGRIISIIDYRAFLALPGSDMPRQKKVVILEDEGGELGFLVDEIEGVERIALTDLQPALPTMNGIQDKYLKGIAGTVAVLDGKKVLSESDLVVHEEVYS
jgi:purine-binding chemotaxis protein CheW